MKGRSCQNVSDLNRLENTTQLNVCLGFDSANLKVLIFLHVKCAVLKIP